MKQNGGRGGDLLWIEWVFKVRPEHMGRTEA